ncbi:MAG: hypothetical protein IKI91_03085 [Clostridia bacterium]|nr:hypothetical protein [Clostridia bacterium]
MKKVKPIVSLILILTLLSLPSCVMNPAGERRQDVITDVIEPLKDGGTVTDTRRGAASDGAGPADGFTEAENAIYDGLVAVDDRISLEGYGLTADTLRASFRRVVNYAPELFYVSSTYGYSHTDDGITAVMPSYLFGKEEIGEKTGFFRETVKKIAAGVDPGWSDLEKALYLHDYVAAHYEFDIDHGIFDAYTFFKEGKGVCQAYTLAYLALLREVGVRADVAASEDMDHTWNKVMIDGNWYHVDLTWDDPVGSAPGETGHTYFLLSDSEIDKKGKIHYRWETVLYESVCADTRYDEAFWEDITTAFAPLGGEWYFIEYREDGSLLRRTDFVSTEDVTVLQGQWDVLDEENMIWLGFYSGLFALDGKLIYNTGTEVMAFDPATGEISSAGAPELGDARIYGCFPEDGKVMCVLCREPHSTDYTVVPLKIEN